MKKRYIAIAGALALSVLLSGCSGSNVTSVDSSQNSGSAKVTSKSQTPQQEADNEAPVQSDTTAVPTVESSRAESTAAPAGESEEEILGTLTMDSPSVNVDYPADWLYGTWSTVSLNGYDYWEYADLRGFDGEVQMIFSSDGGKVTRGSEGVIVEFTFKVTDSGVTITDKLDGSSSELTYDPAADTLTSTDDDVTVVFIRGANPRDSGAENPVGEGIYGLWSVSLVNGEDFWTSDRMAPEQSGECFVEINESGLRAIDNYDVTEYFKVRPTDNGAEFTDSRDGQDYVLTYDETADTITAFQKSQPNGDTMVMKRGSNPKPGTQNGCGWLYGTWSAVTVNGQDFWAYAQESGIDCEWQLVFSLDICFVISGDTAKCSYTADGSSVTILSGISTSQNAMYNSSTDMLMLNDEQAGQTIVMKRGTNPRS